MLELRRFDDAVRLLRVALGSDADNADAWCMLGRAYLELGDTRQAFEAASRASAVAPEYEWPQRLLSAAATRNGEHLRAVTRAEHAVRLAPHAWQTHARLAHAHRGAGDLDAAAAAARRAVELAPDQPDTHMAVGLVASAAKRRRVAKASFLKALSLDPDNSGAHHALAAVQARGRGFVSPGRFASAAGGFAAAMRADPRSAASRRGLEVVLHLFLRRLAYFIFVAAWIAYFARTSPSLAARLVPIALLVLPVAYAGRFVLGLPRELRPYLVRRAFIGGNRAATCLELVAIGALIASAVVPAHARGALIVAAVLVAIMARVILRNRQTQVG